mmetsp:Transcript_9342/g.17468  ORF Transcript_9342/g.17468 Transcript_9342/m.17468 type:complete len:528 (+) Transcript_9342:1264-2847(+)
MLRELLVTQQAVVRREDPQQPGGDGELGLPTQRPLRVCLRGPLPQRLRLLPRRQVRVRRGQLVHHQLHARLAPDVVRQQVQQPAALPGVLGRLELEVLVRLEVRRQVRARRRELHKRALHVLLQQRQHLLPAVHARRLVQGGDGRLGRGGHVEAHPERDREAGEEVLEELVGRDEEDAGDVRLGKRKSQLLLREVGRRGGLGLHVSGEGLPRRLSQRHHAAEGLLAQRLATSEHVQPTPQQVRAEAPLQRQRGAASERSGGHRGLHSLPAAVRAPRRLDGGGRRERHHRVPQVRHERQPHPGNQRLVVLPDLVRHRVQPRLVPRKLHPRHPNVGVFPPSRLRLPKTPAWHDDVAPQRRQLAILSRPEGWEHERAATRSERVLLQLVRCGSRARRPGGEAREDAGGGGALAESRERVPVGRGGAVLRHPHQLHRAGGAVAGHLPHQHQRVVPTSRRRRRHLRARHLHQEMRLVLAHVDVHERIVVLLLHLSLFSVRRRARVQPKQRAAGRLSQADRLAGRRGGVACGR